MSMSHLQDKVEDGARRIGVAQSVGNVDFVTQMGLDAEASHVLCKANGPCLAFGDLRGFICTEMTYTWVSKIRHGRVGLYNKIIQH
jgi:hypothetical protein